MRVERTLKRALEPLTGPAMRRRLIAGRDQAVSAVAGARGRVTPDRPDPDFLVIGAQKAGTTFLYQELVRHPDVRPALTKELHYFDDRYRRGAGWYRGHFPRRADGGLTGEASPGYLFHPHAPARVATDLADVRAIAVLRDPVERAFSHWAHERRLGYEPLADFASAIDAEEERTAAEIQRVTEDPTYVSFAFRHYTYRARGRYLAQIRRWIDALDATRVLVLSADDLYGQPADTMATVHQFLDLDPWQPTALGANDMARGSTGPDPGVARDLRTYFRDDNAELERALGIGGGW